MWIKRLGEAVFADDDEFDTPEMDRGSSTEPAESFYDADDDNLAHTHNSNIASCKKGDDSADDYFRKSREPNLKKTLGPKTNNQNRKERKHEDENEKVKEKEANEEHFADDNNDNDENDDIIDFKDWFLKAKSLGSKLMSVANEHVIHGALGDILAPQYVPRPKKYLKITILGSSTNEDSIEMAEQLGRWVASARFNLITSGSSPIAVRASRGFVSVSEREGVCVGVAHAHCVHHQFIDVPLFTEPLSDPNEAEKENCKTAIHSSDLVVLFPASENDQSLILATTAQKPIIFYLGKEQWDKHTDLYGQVARNSKDLEYFLESFISEQLELENNSPSPPTTSESPLGTIAPPPAATNDNDNSDKDNVIDDTDDTNETNNSSNIVKNSKGKKSEEEDDDDDDDDGGDVDKNKSCISNIDSEFENILRSTAQQQVEERSREIKDHLASSAGSSVGAASVLLSEDCQFELMQAMNEDEEENSEIKTNPDTNEDFEVLSPEKPSNLNLGSVEND